MGSVNSEVPGRRPVCGGTSGRAQGDEAGAITRSDPGAHLFLICRPTQEVAVKVIKKELFKGHKEEIRLKAEESFLPRHRSAGSPIVFAGSG